MTKKPDLSHISAAVADLHKQDKHLEAELEAERVRRTELPLESIQPRPHGNTRDIDQEHVESLAESVAALGLLEPLVVDKSGYLIAGAHRLAAIKLLDEQGRWTGAVPVRMLEALDADKDPHGALAAEVAENEKRRDYTRQEILALAAKLKKAGFKTTRGRPRAGEKALVPMLAAVVGKSRRRVEQVLSGEQVERKNRNISVFSSLRRLDHLREQIHDELAHSRKPTLQKLRKELEALGALLEAALSELDEAEG